VDFQINHEYITEVSRTALRFKVLKSGKPGSLLQVIQTADVKITAKILLSEHFYDKCFPTLYVVLYFLKKTSFCSFLFILKKRA